MLQNQPSAEGSTAVLPCQVMYPDKDIPPNWICTCHRTCILFLFSIVIFISCFVGYHNMSEPLGVGVGEGGLVFALQVKCCTRIIL